MANSADPDQLTSSEANWSGSTLFAKTGYISWFSRTRVNIFVWTSTIYYPMLYLKLAGWVGNSIEPDEMPYFAAFYLGLHCLLRPVSPNTCGKYGTVCWSFTLSLGV